MELKEIAAALRCYHLNDLPEGNPIRRAHDALLAAHDRLAAQPAAEPVCPHIRSSGTTHWCALSEPHVDGWPLYSGLPPAARRSKQTLKAK